MFLYRKGNGNKTPVGGTLGLNRLAIKKKNACDYKHTKTQSTTVFLKKSIERKEINIPYYKCCIPLHVERLW
jgi:hypothetical protein